ncbi:orotidine 5'-phosphate decarboxylase [Candidatus Kaiserbacteria bacterium RIFCSPHIGHO2_12_FULL_56_13]|uniref:Orotidine-5'-phosphate decarboxylase n=1 Tax=Candidatus Kaiserbacteria bacterium RIFCSPHIGHO2_12_FULL_56_13 TaxID=1798505 RepID=A0A1F6EDS0_9BACT|nr:MAG: orotidine 5'-phosphate decarboxylase [Candidatus Kaiserbacteria bacterium RIFCSPHIGHO2_12_FULL_56_13]
MNTFFSMIEKRWSAGARVCIGLDAEKSRLPKEFQTIGTSGQARFNLDIVQATKDLALCYKPNIKFYPGPAGLAALMLTVETIRTKAPGVPVILDAKYADIGNTNKGAVTEAFEIIGADAVTVNPYFGKEALQPFLERDDKGIIVLCRTSNPGAGEFQNLLVQDRVDEITTVLRPLYEKVALNVAQQWNTHGNCALVVGATAPKELMEIRGLVPTMPILIPGIGTQGGDVAQAVWNGANSQKAGVIINSSSGIIFNPDPRLATQKLTDEIDGALSRIPDRCSVG